MKKGTIFLILAVVLLISLLTFVYLDQNKLTTPIIDHEPLSYYEPIILDLNKINEINSQISDEQITESPILINNLEITSNESIANENIDFNEYGQQYFLLQFIGPIQNEWKLLLVELNVEFYDYIPEFAYKVKLHPKQIPEVLKFKFVYNIVEYQSDFKIPTNTQNKLDSIKDSEIITLYIETFDESSSLISLLNQTAETYYQDSDNVYFAKIKKAYISYIIEIGSVKVVEEIQPITITNDYSSDIIESDPTATLLNLDGSSQIVGIIDSGIDTGVDAATEGDIHLDFDNRVNNLYVISNAVCNVYGKSCTSPDDVNGHGTHTSGSVLSNGSRSSGQFQGVAPQANLTFYAAGDDDGSRSIYIASLDSTMLQTGYNDGARIHSNSWGSSTTEYSSGLAKRMDSFMWDNKDILIITSSGNDGSSLQTVRDPGTAKNVLTVGASQSNRSGSGYGTDIAGIASFSSRGPANDNRTKPDVVAPGTNIVSTRSSQLAGGTQSCNSAYDVDSYYSTCSGTSMSAPLTAGYATLVRENFIENLDYQLPMASLVKAMIINGAEDIGFGIPSNHSGWGRVNMTNTLIPTYPKYFKFIDNTTGFSSSNEFSIHTINVINSTTDLKITLVWTDYESTSSASKNLVNDLDLIITSPNGTVYYANNPSWPYNQSQDRLNNVEQLTLNSTAFEVETGIYVINVSAYSISNANQDYSLIISGGLNVSPTTTNFDGVTTIPSSGIRYYAFNGFTIENTTYGKIVWNDNVYLADINFNNHLIFANNNVWGNSTSLHSTLTTTNMTISLYNLSFEEPMPMKDANVCSGCQLISSSSGIIEFYSTGFSNYSAVENSSLDIWDMTDANKAYANFNLRYQNEEVFFYANYTNHSSSLPITTASCTIAYNDSTSATMSYNSSIALYQYNNSFSSPLDIEYNVSCNDTTYYPRNSTNSTTISDINDVYPWQPTNITITYNSNDSITLSWNSTKDAGTFGLLYDSNVTLLWEFDDTQQPNITSITDLSYTDNAINTTTQRYYKVVALNSTSRTNASNSTTGVFKKEIPVTTGNPNTDVELVTISSPLNVSDLSLSTLIPTASDNDMIYTYNSTSAQPESVQYFDSFGWFGDFSELNTNQGYVFKPVTTAFNVTFVGTIQTTNSTFTLKQSTNIAGNATELNLIGLNTPQTKCDLDTIFYGASSGDTLFRYNVATAAYETASFDGATWVGDFDCINPGEGYEMRIVTSEYSVNYER
jgi:subtilisin family serine protease